MKRPWQNFLKRRFEKAAANGKGSNKYQAVEIKAGLIACVSAERLRGRRFLVARAPELPLQACDQRHCSCTYQHRADRRQGPRRDADMGLGGFDRPNDRRARKSRRAEDAPRAAQQSTSYFDYASSSEPDSDCAAQELTETLTTKS